MLRKTALVVAFLVAAVLLYALTRPDTLHVERSVTVNAPPEKIYPLINDYRNWSAWSPYEKKDPAMKRTFNGPTSGKGAVYAWDGDKNVGKGRMEIVDTSPSSKITIKLDFERPFEANNVVNFTIQPTPTGSNVTWAMDGPMPCISKLMSVFINMDTMIGKDFEAGLANLKTVAEK